jgi:Tannase and feruloyl esterase
MSTELGRHYPPSRWRALAGRAGHSGIVRVSAVAAAAALAVGLGVQFGGVAPVRVAKVTTVTLRQAGTGAIPSLSKDSAALASTSPHIPAQIPCASVATLPELGTIPGYPTEITSATDVAASGGNPEYCNVQGLIAPQIQFDLELPVSTWQGRYLQNGCGGYCGSVTAQSFPSCDATLGGDFAMATDNEGHSDSIFSGLWAFNDEQLRVDYGYESEHALAVVAKTIIHDYYGTGPTYSYFDGCSDGGREAMAVAERYPTDFNGIIAGAPEIIAGPLNAEEQTWNYRVNSDSQGNAILTSDKLPALHAAVIQACAGDDGTNDGIITDPRNCDFNPASIQCPAGTDNDSCLTPAEVTVARELYQGPVDSHGQHLYPGGLPYGSESSWAGFVVPVTPANGGPVSATAIGDYSLSQAYLRYQLLQPGVLGPSPDQWQFTDQDFNEMFPAANAADAMSTDLSQFFAHGGKLIMWQGTADQAIPVFGTIDYYETLAQRMGGFANAQQSARLFLFPTVAHCGGGYAGSSFDLVLPLVDWVEQGTAPSQVIATDSLNGTTLTRPVYPYPEVPMYNGTGPVDDASSFNPVVSPNATEYTNWIGNFLFSRPDGD